MDRASHAPAQEDGGQKVVSNALGNTRKATKFSNHAIIARAGLNFHF